MDSGEKIYAKLNEELRTGFEGGLIDYTITEMSYHSNRIEGSSLTEEQTVFMYEHGALINDGEIVSVNDVKEMMNHFDLFRKMFETIHEPLSEELIKEYHRVLKSNTKDESLGFSIDDYKKKGNRVGNIITSAPWDVKDDMENLLITYNFPTEKAKTLVAIVDFHSRFETIHPFQDGNGRVGRMIMFKECLKNNIVPFIVKEDTKNQYYRGLKEYYNNPHLLLAYAQDAQHDYEKEAKYFIPDINISFAKEESNMVIPKQSPIAKPFDKSAYVSELPKDIQDKIREAVLKEITENDDYTPKDIKRAMESRFCDLNESMSQEDFTAISLLITQGKGKESLKDKMEKAEKKATEHNRNRSEVKKRTTGKER